MIGSMQPLEDKESLQDIPQKLANLPLRDTVAFPFMILPLSVGVPRSIKLVENAMHGNRLIGLVTSKDPRLDEPVPEKTYTVGGTGTGKTHLARAIALQCIRPGKHGRQSRVISGILV